MDSKTSDYISAHLSDVIRTLGRTRPGKLAQAVAVCDEARINGGCLFLCGNGGSAATALHAACDLTKVAHVEGHRRLRAVALVDNVAVLTAYGNDDGYSRIFVNQLSGVLTVRDVVLGISTSGESENVLCAMEYARAAGAKTIGMSGVGTARMRRCATVMIELPGDTIQATEDGHMVLLHALSMALRANLLAVGNTCRPDVTNAGT